jgi:vacuolar-type H+-ATPase subunit H
VDVQQKLDQLTAMVEGARSMPMSASIVVNKTELMTLLAELREALPSEIAQAQQTVQQGDLVVEEARREAEQIVAAAHQERQQLISGTDIALHAQAEADRILGEARAEAEEQRREADDYVDSKLANFEVVLTKTLGAISRGRAKLAASGAPVEGEDGEEFTQDAFRSPSPEVDEYVDVKLATLEAALGKTLEAVGRGRDKLLGKKPIDELADYLAAADQHSGNTVEQGDARQAAVAAELAQQGLLPQQELTPQTTVEYWQPPQPDQYGYDTVYEQQQYAPHQPQQGYDPYYPQQPAAGYEGYDAYGQPVPQAQPVQQVHIPAQQLDETSFFDTSFIDVSKLREYGQGHH